MAKFRGDPECALCSGSGIDPESAPTYHPGAPGIPDPAGWEPCECIVRQWARENPKDPFTRMVRDRTYEVFGVPQDMQDAFARIDMSREAGEAERMETDHRIDADSRLVRWHDTHDAVSGRLLPSEEWAHGSIWEEGGDEAE